MSTVEIQQNHMCIADLPTDKIRHLINKWEGGTREEAAQKKDIVLLGSCGIFRTWGILI